MAPTTQILNSLYNYFLICLLVYGLLLMLLHGVFLEEKSVFYEVTLSVIVRKNFV